MREYEMDMKIRLCESNHEGDDKHEESQYIDCTLFEENVSNNCVSSQLNSLKWFCHHKD